MPAGDLLRIVPRADADADPERHAFGEGEIGPKRNIVAVEPGCRDAAEERRDQVAHALREELGDLLLQVVFQSELARSRGWFGPLTDDGRAARALAQARAGGPNQVLRASRRPWSVPAPTQAT